MDMSTEHVEGIPVPIITLLIVPWENKNENLISEIFILGTVELLKKYIQAFFPKTMDFNGNINGASYIYTSMVPQDMSIIPYGTPSMMPQHDDRYKCRFNYSFR